MLGKYTTRKQTSSLAILTINTYHREDQSSSCRINNAECVRGPEHQHDRHHHQDDEEYKHDPIKSREVPFGLEREGCQRDADHGRYRHS